LYVKKQKSRSNDIKNIKSRSADIKIQFSLQIYTLGLNFMSVRLKKESRSNDSCYQNPIQHQKLHHKFQVCLSKNKKVGQAISKTGQLSVFGRGLLNNVSCLISNL
jgi:hypothetical protein